MTSCMFFRRRLLRVLSCAPRSSLQRAILHRCLQYIWTEPTTARVQQVSRSVSRACCSKCGERATPTPRPPSTRVFPCQPLSRALDRIAPCSSIHLNRPRPAIPLRALLGRTHTAASLTLHHLVACGTGCLPRSRASPTRRVATQCELSQSHTGRRGR